jgi:hypothetical protein
MESKESKALDRGALADLWKHTLSSIPTHYGRLVYLGSIMEPDSGRYRHHGLATVFGRNESHAALRDSHLEIFVEWLSLPLAARHADLLEYLKSLPHPTDQIVRNWRRTKAYRSCIPLSAKPVEKQLFCADIEALLSLAPNAADPSRPDSSPPE